MKKIVCLVLVLTAVICCLASCDARYIPVAGFTVVGPYVTVLELPTKELGGETTLEFWIGENLTDNDISGHTKVYDGFLGEGYGLDENKELPKYYVRYTVDNYPKIDSFRQGVLQIKITDPEVKVYGLTTETSLEDFEELFTSLGTSMVIKNDTGVRAKIGEVWFSLNTPTNGVPYITISTRATGAVMID